MSPMEESSDTASRDDRSNKIKNKQSFSVQSKHRRIFESSTQPPVSYTYTAAKCMFTMFALNALFYFIF